jgi:5'-nucleotidase
MRLTSPSQVHNSTPATALVSISPSDARGAIDILDGTKIVATETAFAGAAAINLPKTLAYGSHKLVARFRPETPAAYSGSSTTALPFKVLSGGTKTAISLSLSKSTQHYKKHAVKVTVHVSHKPAGKVAIFDGTKKLKTLTLKKGAASYTLSKKFAKGKHKLHAEFMPKHIDSFAPSVSKSKTVTVVK